ncbi:acyltransferase-like protein At3g26840, chloroplastic [Morus notabilis]|uniref:acyltransferase-like protein At3g26840, chloroplastic n=1 Tax=Morus notabilis TaxID=981085 RepID=UPI000CED5A44|nr:acyltransferase-like protein At3g26840, chloroplastic [Morus notabilis]
MASTVTPLFPAAIFCCSTNSPSGTSTFSSSSNPIPTRRLKAEHTDAGHLRANTTKRTDGFSAENMRRFEKIRDNGAPATRPFSLEDPENRRSVKDYLEQTKDLVRSVDGGPPRWFSPLDCAAFSRLNDSPLLLFLPGIDGVGLGLIMHYKKLGEIFDVWCLHIPVKDRTPFSELVKLVEKTVRSEHHRSPNRPIYLVGETIGACLALSVAALNPDIDLVLILANPGTSFRQSQLQLLIPLLEVAPESFQLSLPYMLSLVSGDSLRMVEAIFQQGLPLPMTIGELSSDLVAMSSYLPVLADILPTKTLLWKLQMLKSASAFSNSRLHAVKAETLIISSGRDVLLPSQKEATRLHQLLPNCMIRNFEDTGHFIFLEDDVDLVTIIKSTSFYRRSRHPDYVFDYIPPTPSEFKKIMESNQWIYVATSPVMLSTLDTGKIVRGLAGIPSEGPVLFVGYHMLLGIDLAPLVAQLLIERNILLRGIAHPMMFMNLQKGTLREFSSFDTYRIMGAVPVSGKNIYKLFSSKSHVLLYPGGMREALHRKGEEYKLFWPEQSEFVRMAARFGAKIIPFGVVGEDDIGEVFFDYEDQIKIPYLRDQIEELTNQVVKLRNDTNGEVANQPVHLPGILPKLPGRFYYYFGKPIETEGRKHELRDREKSHELYLQVKSEVERCIAYLKEKREKDRYRNILPRLVYQATNGFTSEVPTFEI